MAASSPSLIETHPELCKEWDYDKNNISPHEISHGSVKKVWWKCENGHEFYRSPNQRTNPRSAKNGRNYTQCPHCSHAVATPGEYSFKTEHPELIEEWDWKSNIAEGIDPDEILPNSGKKVHWMCKNNPKHKWVATPNNRITGGRKRQGSGCPYCDGKTFKEGITDLETMYPEIAAEWDYEHNSDTPNHVHAGSTRNAHWICPKGHHYDMPPARRTKQGQGCSVCAGKKVIYETSLAFLYPDIAAEWDYKRNKALPEEVASKSSKKAWWICSENPKHRYEATIASRTFNHTGCPFCAGHQVLPEESFGALYPNLLTEWDYDKNTDVDPFSCTPGSNRKVWWKCSNGHSWQTSIRIRTSGHGCAECKSGTMTSFAEQLFFIACCKIFPQYKVINRYITDFGEEIDIYIPQLSLGIEPGNWVLHKNKYDKDKYKRKACRENNIRLITIYDEYRESKLPFEDDFYIENKFFGNGCNYLLVRNILQDLFIDIDTIDENIWNDNVWKKIAEEARYASNRKVPNPSCSLAASKPEIAAEWHPCLNGDLTPECVYPSSKQMIYWQCSKGHEFVASVHSRVYDGKGCSICSKRVADSRYNTISKLYPEFVDMFDESNEISPDEITPFNSTHDIKWKCPHCNEVFERKPAIMFQGSFSRCPICGEIMPHTPSKEIEF